MNHQDLMGAKIIAMGGDVWKGELNYLEIETPMGQKFKLSAIALHGPAVPNFELLE